MAHILVGGDHRAGEGLSRLLKQWGLTCGVLPRGDWPTIHDCDAVILVLPWPADLLVGPEASAATPAAPLVLLGSHPGPLLLARDAQQVLPDIGPEGQDLRSALQAALETAQRLRGNGSPDFSSHDREGYLHFLGHELRSPLTAAKTALEVLQGELGGLSGPGSAEDEESASRLKMLEIALRNVHRLQRTVDWSQDLLELEMAAPRSRWARIPVDSMADAVEEAAHLFVCDRARGRFLDSDPNLLRVLVGQMIRVFQFALPDCPLSGQVRLAEHREGQLELELHPAADCGCQDGPRITRTHLTPVAGTLECSAQEELERLVGYVVSRPLLSQLQAEIKVSKGPQGRPSLILSLALARTDSGLEASPAALHAPA